MAQQITNKGITITKYLEKYPDAPALTLAKKIYYENKMLFKDIESVRKMVRYYFGSSGKKHMKNITNRKFIREKRFSGIVLPEPKMHFEHPEPYEPELEKTLIIGDIHAPYYDKTALATAIEYGLKNECTTLLINGDFLDHYAASRWEKDPKKRDWGSEYKTSMELLKILRETFRSVIWKKGNHDQWYDKYMQLKAPEAFAIPHFEFNELYKVDELGIKLIEDWRIIKYGRLHILHGHEYKFSISNPVGAARGLFLKNGGTNALCHHFHSMTEYSKNTLDKRIVSCWSVGCLCGIQEYSPHGDQTHGFAILSFDDEKQFHIENKKIINGKVY